MKKVASGATVWIVAMVLSFLVYIFLPNPFSSLSKRMDDMFFLYHPHKKPLDHIVIVDIDEKSLASLGQWPWERNLIAQLLTTISENGAGIIGLDVVFAEEDKTSPSYINRHANLGLLHPLDYDRILAESIRNIPAIGGYVFDMKHAVSANDPTKNPVIIVEKQRDESQEISPPFLSAKGAVPNIPQLQGSFLSNGFFNVFPDPSGMVRNAPLLIRYKDTLYPSLDVEMIRMALGESKIILQYSQYGIETIQLGERIIPVNALGSMPIRFRGPKHTFPYVSAVDVLNNKIPLDTFKNKFVLIGSSAAGLLDLRSTPLDSAIPGVEIHANILDNILSGDFLAKPYWVDGLNVTIYAIIFTLAFFLFLSLSAIWVLVATAALTWLIYHGVAWVLFDQGYLINTSFPFLALLLAFFASILVNYFFETRQKKIIRKTLSKKVSPAVAQELIEHANVDILRNRQEEITVFFSDIRDFTSLSETIESPQALIRLLNRYIDPMVNIIYAQRGTVDKFIGDAIMAYWNAPHEVTDHSDRAVICALEQMEALHKVNHKNAQLSLPDIRIGIGINTGSAIVGELGSEGRSDFTVIGDSVNLASRLQDLNKRYGTAIIISENTRRHLKQRFILRELDVTQVRGKEESIRIYEVLGRGEPDAKLKKELDTYHAALKDYQARHLKRAQEQFEILLRRSPSKLYQFHCDRIRHLVESTLPEVSS